MTSSNLPPGVTTSMLPGNRPEDLLADAIADGWRPRCQCGSFLSLEAQKSEPWEETIQCSGKPTKIEQQYSDEVLDIIGEEFRGHTYTVYYTDCAADTGPEGHEAHTEIMAAGITEYRICKRCGHENKETVM